MCLAIPGQIVELVSEQPATWAWSRSPVCAAASTSACSRTISPGVGDWVLIHVGFAMSKISEAEARWIRCGCSRCSARTEAAMEEVRGYGFGWRRSQEPT